MERKGREAAAEPTSRCLQASPRSLCCLPPPLRIPRVADWRHSSVCAQKRGGYAACPRSVVLRDYTGPGLWGAKQNWRICTEGRLKGFKSPPLKKTIQTHLASTPRFLLLISLIPFKVLARPKSKALEPALANLGALE